MGFMDSVGSAFKSTWSGATHSLGFVMDMGKALDKTVVAPTLKYSGINSVMAADAWAYSHLVARPISTTLQMAGDVNPVMGGSFSHASDLADPGKYQQFYNDGVSPGQAALRNTIKTLDLLTPGDKFSQAYGIDGKSGADLAAVGNKEDASYNPGFSILSGATDAVTNWYLDPMNVAGKGVKAAQKATKEIDAAKGDIAAIAGATEAKGIRQKNVVNTTHNFIEGTDGLSASQIMRIKGMTPALADVLARSSGEHDVKRMVLLTAMGDTVAKGRLQAMRSDIAARIDRAQSGLDNSVLWSARTAEEDGQLTLAALYGDDFKRAQDEMKANERLLDVFDKVLPSEQSGRPVNPGVFGSLTQAPKLGRQAQRAIAKDSEYIAQDGVLGTPIRVASLQHPFTKRAGVIDLDNADDAYEQVRDMLRQTPGISPEQRKGILDNLLATQDRNARQLSVQAAEGHVFRALGAKHGLEREQIEALLNETYRRRDQLMRVRKTQVYAAGTDANGRRVDLIPHDDGSFEARPIMETQLAAEHPLLDVVEVDRVLRRNASALKAMGEVSDMTKRGFDLASDIWRTSVLLRGGYLIRNVGDATLRQVAYLGGLAHLANIAHMTGASLRRKSGSINSLAAQKPLADEIASMDAKIAERRASLGEAASHDNILMTMQDQREALAHTQASLGLSDEIAPHFDQRPVEVGPYQMQGSAGPTAETRNARHAQISSDKTFAEIARDESERALGKMRTGDWDLVTGTSEDWVPAYARVVNQHIRQDQVASRLLAGMSRQQVTDWLGSAEGRAYRRQMVHGHDTPERLVEAQERNLNHIMPDPELRARAAEGPLAEADIEAAFPSQEMRPVINAEVQAHLVGHGTAAAGLRRMRDNAMRFLNTIPEDVMGRHPFADALYRGRMKQLVRQADPTLSGDLTELEQRAIEQQARAFSNQEMRRVLFDVTRKDNLAYAMRFMSPFFAAWEDQMVKYGRLIARDPSLVSHAWQIWTAPNASNFVDVVDKNGDPVPKSKSRLTDGEYIRTPLPFLKSLGIGEAKISKSSFNIALQGDPWWLPGFGPIAAAPINEIAKGRPQVADSMSAILPYGSKTSTLDLVLPSALRNLRHASDSGLEDRNFASTVVNIYAQELTDYKTGKTHVKPSYASAQSKAKKFWALRTFTSLTSPVSVTYQSPYQFYIDEAHRFRTKYGQDWEQKYLDAYGEDYFTFASSLSKNNTGIQSTKQAWKTSRALKDVVAIDPELGWMVVGPDNTGEFNRNVYTSQQVTTVGPGSSQTYRGAYGPREAIAKNNAELGWTQYRQAMSIIDATLAERGLNINSAQAAPLAEAKRQMIQQMKQQNPDWADDFDSRDEGQVRRALTMMQRLTEDKRTASRPDVQAMGYYLQGRALIQQVLAARVANGGDRSLTSKQNADVAQVWSAFTQGLLNQYIQFQDVYHRVLDNDNLADPTPGIEEAA